MVNQFGCRPVMLIGGLLASSGMILASFTTNIIELYLTAGVLTGERPGSRGEQTSLSITMPSHGHWGGISIKWWRREGRLLCKAQVLAKHSRSYQN